MKIFIQTPTGTKNKINNHTISHLSYFDFLTKRRSFIDFIKNGVSGSTLFAKLMNPFYFHKLYLEKDKLYFNFLHSFKEKYIDYDVIVMNPGVDLVHPEFLIKHFPNTLKCLHFIDDPHATYSYGFPYAWAFDCATYISPSYNQLSMVEILNNVGLEKNRWFPHCVTNNNQPKYEINHLSEQLNKRNNKALYVGGFYSGKIKRLIYLKNMLKSDFDIFGRYPLNGFSFPLISLFNKKINFYRVRSLTEEALENYYSNYAIGVNMHLSYPARETGNARTYELAYRGLAQVVDDGNHSLINKIFKPEKEILTYHNIKECVDQIRRLQNNNDLRVKIATNAYEKAIKEYNYPYQLNKLIKWFKSLI